MQFQVVFCWALILRYLVVHVRLSTGRNASIFRIEGYSKQYFSSVRPIIQKVTMRVSVPGPSHQQNQAHDTKDTLYLAASLLPILSVCGCHGSLVSARCCTLQLVSLSFVCSSHRELLHSAPFKLSFNFCASAVFCAETDVHVFPFFHQQHANKTHCHRYCRNKAYRDTQIFDDLIAEGF